MDPTELAFVVDVDNNIQDEHITAVKATEFVRERVSCTEDAFAEIVVWKVPSPLPGSRQMHKYRLAFVVEGECLLRHDNEAGKGDHRHVRGEEFDYSFQSTEQVVVDFNAEVRRLNNENGNP